MGVVWAWCIHSYHIYDTSLILGAIMLQEYISSVDDYEFEIEQLLAEQVGAIPLPFPGMDSK